MISYLLLILGLLLIFFEFYLPGAILSIIGGILIFISIVFFALHTQSALETLLFIIVALLLVGGVIKFALWRLRTARSTKSIYLRKDQEGYVASHYDARLIGKQGIALSDLKPAGHIRVEGQSHQAVSSSGYITKGSAVTITGGEGAHFIVKETKTDHPNLT